MEDFVTFEIAKKLKEKGFKEHCLAHYGNTGGFYSNVIDTYDRPNQDLDYIDFLNCFNAGNSIGLIDAPTISQVLKWLRKEKKIHITVLVITECDKDADNNICKEWFWSFSIINLNDGSTVYDDFEKIDCIEYQSYEEAALAGIEYVLDNLL